MNNDNENQSKLIPNDNNIEIQPISNSQTYIQPIQNS